MRSHTSGGMRVLIFMQKARQLDRWTKLTPTLVRRLPAPNLWRHSSSCGATECGIRRQPSRLFLFLSYSAWGLRCCINLDTPSELQTGIQSRNHVCTVIMVWRQENCSNIPEHSVFNITLRTKHCPMVERYTCTIALSFLVLKIPPYTFPLPSPRSSAGIGAGYSWFVDS